MTMKKMSRPSCLALVLYIMLAFDFGRYSSSAKEGSFYIMHCYEILSVFFSKYLYSNIAYVYSVNILLYMYIIYGYTIQYVNF